MAKFVDAQRDADDLAKLVNEDTEVTTRYGDNPKKSWLYMQDEFNTLLAGFTTDGNDAIDDLNVFIDAAKIDIANDVTEVDNAKTSAIASITDDLNLFDAYYQSAKDSLDDDVAAFTIDSDAALTDFAQNSADAFNEFDLTLDQYKESRGFNNKGTFTAGFTYELPNDVGIDASGNPWIYNGALPFTVTAGTTPTSPTYTQVSYGVASQVSTNTSDTVQSFADSFALKIFQSPTDGGLTEIQTRTVNSGEVYEVRKTSDDSLATIYSDSTGVNEITQNGVDNVSDSSGVVAFYIDDGDYYISYNSLVSEFIVGVYSTGYKLDFLNVDKTGSTDESVKFSTAIDNAKLLGGGVLDVGSGTVKLNLEKSVSGITIKGTAKLVGGADRCLVLNGDNNTVEGVDVEDTNRNTATLWLNGDNNTAYNVKAYNAVKSTSPIALFGDLIRVSGNDNQVLFCEGYNGYTGLKVDGGNSPTERVTGVKVWGCKFHDNIRGCTIKPEVEGATIQSNEFNDNDVNEDQGSDGLLCERNVKDLNIQFNQLHRNGEHGLYLQGSGCDVSHNHANDNVGSGLKFGGKKNSNFNDSNGALTDTQYNAQYVSEDCIVSHNHTYRNGLGNTNSGIYLQETHKGYKIDNNIVKFNEYGVRAVNQEAGGEIENLTISNNTVSDSIVKDVTLAVTDKVLIDGGVYDIVETFMPDRVFEDIVIKNSTIKTLNSASVQSLSLENTKITEDFNTSSAATINVNGGLITSTSDINLSKFLDISNCDIIIDGDFQLTSVVSCNLENMSNVDIYAPDSTGNIYNIPASNAPDNVNFNNVRIHENSGVRAMDIYGNGHTVTGVVSNTVSGQDVVQIRGNDCTVMQCKSRVSVTARVTASGNNNIIIGNQLTALDAGTGNTRLGNRSEP